MRSRTMFVAGGFALLIAAASAGAQSSKKPVRKGVIPPSPPAQPVVVNTTGLPMGNTTGLPANTTGLPANTPGTPATNVVPVPIAQITYYPTLVFSDGRVLANFGTGRGYEEVLRKCPDMVGTLPPGTVVAPCWTVDAYGVYRVLQRR